MEFKIGDIVKIKQPRNVVSTICVVENHIPEYPKYQVFGSSWWYVEEDLELVRSYEDGMRDGIEQGHDEALCTITNLFKLYPTDEAAKYLNDMSYDEIVDLFNKENFKVGDFIRAKRTGGIAVITKIEDDGFMYIMWNDGSTGETSVEDSLFTKTGESIDISEMLDRMEKLKSALKKEAK